MPDSVVPGFVEDEAVLGREALRRYLFVYAALADASRSTAAFGMVAVLKAFLGGLQFHPGEPESSSDLCGYSERSDVLWLRPYRVLGAWTARPGSRRRLAFEAEVRKGKGALPELEIASGMQVFSGERSLERRLREFTESDQWHDWQTKPVNIRNPPFEESHREAYFWCAGTNAQTIFPYRGTVLVGRSSRGLVLLGVREQEWLARASVEVRTQWLREAPGACRRLRVPAPLVRRHRPSFVAHRGTEWIMRDSAQFWRVARLLLQWQALPAPNPWYWRRAGSNRFHYLDRFVVGRSTLPIQFVSNHPSFQMGNPLSSLSRDFPRSSVLLLVSDEPMPWLETQVTAVFSEWAAGRPSIRTLDRAGVERMARRYEWLVNAMTFARRSDAVEYALAANPESGIAPLFACLARPRRQLVKYEEERWIDLLPRTITNPWLLLRAYELLFRRDLRALSVHGPAQVEEKRVSYLVETFPREFLWHTRRSPWAESVPDRGEPAWWSVVRWLRAWKAAGRVDVAAGMAEHFKERVERNGGSSGPVLDAWNATWKPQRYSGRNLFRREEHEES